MFIFHELPKRQHTEQFIFTARVYSGGGNNYQNFVLKAKKQDALRIYLEMVVLQCQFPGGRGGCSEYYNQLNYFSPETRLVQDDRWNWLYDDYPYDGDAEQNYSLKDIKMQWVNEDGDRFDVESLSLDNFKSQLYNLGIDHKLGNGSIWPWAQPSGKDAFDQDDGSLDQFFLPYLAYRADVIALIDEQLEENQGMFEFP